MTIYVDTSVLVGSLTAEPRAAELQDWLADASGLHISWWSMTEFRSALARKSREGFPVENRERAERNFRHLVTTALVVLPVSAAHFERAGQIVANAATGLRSSDALHLGIAALNDLEVVTLDKRMASGGTVAGVVTLLL